MKNIEPITLLLFIGFVILGVIRHNEANYITSASCFFVSGVNFMAVIAIYISRSKN